MVVTTPGQPDWLFPSCLTPVISRILAGPLRLQEQSRSE
jgi:hypothetical protein